MNRLRICFAICCVALLMPASPASAQPGGLLQLLSSAKDSATAQTVVWFGSLGNLKAQTGANVSSASELEKLPEATKRLFLMESDAQLYYSSFSGFERADWQPTFGFSAFAMSAELTVGAGRNRFAILNGSFNDSAIRESLSKLGYQPASFDRSVLSLGSDNEASTIAEADLNRILVSSNQIIAAPSDAMMQAALGAGAAPLALARPDFAAIATQLDQAALISAVIYDGAYLNVTVFGAGTLRQQIGAVADQIGLTELTLARYSAAGVGYQFDGNRRTRTWLIVLSYPSQDGAVQAVAALQARLNRYVSVVNPGAPLFQGWQIDGGVSASDGTAMARITLVQPDGVDISWAQLLRDRDVAFLYAP